MDADASSPEAPEVPEDRSWCRGRRGALLVLAFYLLVTIVMTWPIAITLDQATGLRGDYFNNIWNSWWVGQSITEGHSPWFTDYLYYPDGLSLKRHTLSPLNSLAGAFFGVFLGPHAALNVLLLLKFALSAWCFYFLARYATGSTLGAVLGGLVYAFNPFHYYYLCQVNVFSFEFVPLAVLFFVKTYRERGWRNPLWAALATGGIVATAEYFVAYAAVAVGLLLLAGRWAYPEVAWRRGAVRVLLAGLPTAAIVILLALPLLIGTFGAEGATAEETGVQFRRANDLLGYAWIGGPEQAIVSWPTMIGYSTLLLLLAGVRRLWRQKYFLVIGAFFFVFGLGATLSIGGEDTGLPLPYAFLTELPVLSMLRKADRSFMMVQFAVALLAAQAWTGLARRLGDARLRLGAWAAVTALVMVELCGAPFGRWDYDIPDYYRTLAADDSVKTVLELPAMDIDTANARYNFYQVHHGKKQPLGYCTTLARSEKNIENMQAVVNSYFVYMVGRRNPNLLAGWARKRGIDIVVHHKTMAHDRLDERSAVGVETSIDDQTLWQPFFMLRKPLVRVRQMGRYVDQEIAGFDMRNLTGLLTKGFGSPIHEDDEVIVFRVTKP